MLLLVAALGISLTLLIQQSMHLAALSNVAVETPNNANATQQRPQSSSDSDEMTDVEPDPEQLPETQTDENSAVTVDDGLVDINTAGLAELQTITGVGPVTAQRIIDYRKTIGRYASVGSTARRQGHWLENLGEDTRAGDSQMSMDWALREQGSRDWRMLPVALTMWARVWARIARLPGGRSARLMRCLGWHRLGAFAPGRHGVSGVDIGSIAGPSPTHALARCTGCLYCGGVRRQHDDDCGRHHRLARFGNDPSSAIQRAECDYGYSDGTCSRFGSARL